MACCTPVKKPSFVPVSIRSVMGIGAGGGGVCHSIELCPSATGLLKEGCPFNILGSPQGRLSQIIPVLQDTKVVDYLLKEGHGSRGAGAILSYCLSQTFFQVLRFPSVRGWGRVGPGRLGVCKP